MPYRNTLNIKVEISLQKYVAGIIEMTNIATAIRNKIGINLYFYILILFAYLVIKLTFAIPKKSYIDPRFC
jgi:hypothetical protein